MNLREHDNNCFIKETSKVENYLMKIIHRYFEIENNYSRETIEAIIIESLSRFKQFVLGNKGFIFSLNRQTGNIVLTIRDLNGEEKFSKNTAFNKDFGDEEDTVCEGNDIRLSDKREPLGHIHDIIDIKKIQQTLEESEFTKPVHFHNNNSVMDVLCYTGNCVAIDLIVVEQLETAIRYYCNNLEYLTRTVEPIYSSSVDSLLSYKTILLECLNNTKELIQVSDSWVEDFKLYIDNKLASLKNKAQDAIITYVLKSSAQNIQNLLNQSFRIVADGELAIPSGVITCNPYQKGVTADGKPWGISYVEEKSEISYSVSSSIMSQIRNSKVKLFFRYNQDGVTMNIPLPFCVKENDGRRSIFVDGRYTSAGNIKVTCRVINKIPCYATNSNIYNSKSVIAASCHDADIYDIIKSQVDAEGCSLCLIDSSAKNTFVKNLLHNNESYFIQGKNFVPDGTGFTDNNENSLTYFNWDTGQPIYTDILNVLSINENKKWAVVNDRHADKLGYILEYKIKKISELYDTPRIYYQVLGNKEGM